MHHASVYQQLVDKIAAQIVAGCAVILHFLKCTKGVRLVTLPTVVSKNYRNI